MILSPISKPFVTANLQSAVAEPLSVYELLSKEVNKRYIMRSFSTPPFNPFRIKSVSIATQKYSGKKRQIFDMSSPHSESWASVNELIPLQRFSTMQYI